MYYTVILGETHSKKFEMTGNFPKYLLIKRKDSRKDCRII